MESAIEIDSDDRARIQRRYPIGAERLENTTSFRVWAPDCNRLSVVLEESGQEYELSVGAEGYFQVDISDLKTGAGYRYRLNEAADLVADPASRFQPDGPDGASRIVDPFSFIWEDSAWPGVAAKGQVLYELHVGTFTQEGTWAAAAERLEQLAGLGVTLIEMMPVNEFCGSFGWGYDGILLYAPTHLYGEPDDLRAFVDRAHLLGIGVILDVVYNHFGVGNHFERFSRSYFTNKHKCEWGRAINFDGPKCKGARTYFAKNAAYWIDEYHFDGLRIDATQALVDESEDHIIAEIARESRMAGKNKPILLLGESEVQDTRLLRPEALGGYGLNAAWNDDFHHSAMVAITGRRQAYYHDYRGSAQELISSAKYGYLYQGQRYDWQGRARGTPGFDLSPESFVTFLQNHDQIANSARGLRLHALCSSARLRAMTTLLLLAPQTPMLFQGQEFAASSPFLYFADHADAAIAQSVRNGRIEFLSQFPSLQDEQSRRTVRDPVARASFEQCKLDWNEYDGNAEIVALHRDLIRRRGEMLGQLQRLDGSVLAPNVLLLRYFGSSPDRDCLLLINLGIDFNFESVAEPLFAPPLGMKWQTIWSSEAIAYGGSGVPPTDYDDRWTISSESALLLGAITSRPNADVHNA